MPASAAAVAVKAEEKAAEPGGGELLYCGTTRFDLMDPGSKGGLHRRGNDLLTPTRLRPLMGVDIRFVATGCAACHCVALGADGRCFTWGRNEKGQLGHGDTLLRDLPTVVSELSKYNIITASVGRNHTVVVTDDGKSFAFGDNKHGQLGTGSLRKGTEVSPAPCLVTEATNAVCGADFTVWLSSVEGSSILTAGRPQYGQLGHGSYNEHNNSNVSPVMLSNHPQPCPRAIATLSGKSVVKVACGTNHTVAVDSSGFVYTWGFGGYGRLGHYEQKDEWQPRLVQIFQKNNVLGPNDVISAGSTTSACTAGGRGQLYMWGQVNFGNPWMYPMPVRDLSGWNIRCMASGSMHHAVGADDSCLSWGPTQRSSVNPKKVEILEEMHVTSVGCGVEMSLIVVDRANVGDKIDQLNIFYGDSDVLFEEKGLFIPPCHNKEEQKRNTSQQHATHKTEGTSEQAAKKATQTTNSWPNKRKTTMDPPQSEVKDEVERNNGPSTRSGRGRPRNETESPERAPLMPGSSGGDCKSNHDAQKKNPFLVKLEEKYVQEE